MKNIVLKYGTISGLIAASLMLISMFIENKYGFGSSSVIIGYTGMILSFIPLYMGVRNFRQTIGVGGITFLKALNVGILIVVISGIFYTVTWLIIYYWITPDFPEKYSAFVLSHIPKDSVKLMASTKETLEKSKEILKNPLINGAVTFTEPLPVGVVMTLICAAVLRKKGANEIQMKDLMSN